MTMFGFRKAGRRALFAAAVGVSAVPAAAQENEAAQPDSGVNLTAERSVRQDSLDAYQVRASETEYLPGRFRVADAREGELRAVGTTGVLVVQNGRIIARGETDIGGVAQIRNLRPGGYSVIAIGPDGMGAFGIEVLPPAKGVETPTYRFDTLIVPAADMAVAQQLIAGATAPAPGVAPPAARAPAPLPPIPASLKKQQEEPFVTPAPLEMEGEGVSDGNVAAPLKGDTVVVPADGRVVSHFVALDAAGRPTPMANTRVFFLRGGRLYGTIATNAEGYCAATGVEDGVYSMVGISPNGFFAFGAHMESVPGNATAGQPAVSTVFVSAVQGGIPTVNLRAAGAGPDAMPFAPGFGGPGPFGPFGPGGPGMFPGGGGPFGGGGGGGMAGGGGGFGGGGLLGALLGAGLGAGLGAALGNDDGDEGGGNNQPPASPNGPPFDPTPGVPGPPFDPPGRR